VTLNKGFTLKYYLCTAISPLDKNASEDDFMG
jgi:hypothetical protein